MSHTQRGHQRSDIEQKGKPVGAGGADAASSNTSDAVESEFSSESLISEGIVVDKGSARAAEPQAPRQRAPRSSFFAARRTWASSSTSTSSNALPSATSAAHSLRCPIARELSMRTTRRSRTLMCTCRAFQINSRSVCFMLSRCRAILRRVLIWILYDRRVRLKRSQLWHQRSKPKL